MTDKETTPVSGKCKHCGHNRTAHLAGTGSCQHMLGTDHCCYCEYFVEPE